MRKMMSDPAFVLFVGWKAQFCKSSTLLNKSLRRLLDISWTKPCSFSITDHRLLINDPTTHQPTDPPTTHYLKVTSMPKLPQIPLCFKPTQPLWNLSSKYLPATLPIHYSPLFCAMFVFCAMLSRQLFMHS